MMKLVSISLNEVAPNHEGKLQVQGLAYAASRIQRLVLKKSLRAIVVVGSGSLGSEYEEISKKYSSNFSGDVGTKAAEANALLLIAALRNLNLRVNASPILFDLGRIDDFISKKNSAWEVVTVIANNEEGKHPSIAAAKLAKKYHAVLLHILNNTSTKKLWTGRK